jgi:hypothetical protein
VTFGDILQNEADGGFVNCRGTDLGGTLSVSAVLLNTMLANLVPGLRLEILASNQIAVHFGPVNATVILADALDLASPSPTLTLTLTSRAKAWLLAQRQWPPFVHIKDTVITLDLGAIPALAAYRQLWPHVQRVTLATLPGTISVAFHVAIGAH